MEKFQNLFQTADWKTEKHVPIIELMERDKNIKLKVSVGKEIPHPNTTEHHIAWIDVYFFPEDENYPYHIGKFDFNSHGASIKGPNTSSVYTHPEVTLTFKANGSGIIFALSYCNIHGLWVNSLKLDLK